MSEQRLARHGRNHGPLGSDPISIAAFGGLRIRGPYRITKDDDLATGVDLFTPDEGDVLYDAFIVVKEAFNDTAVDATRLRLYRGATQWNHPLLNQLLDLGFPDDESAELSIGNGSANTEQMLTDIDDSGSYGRFAVIVLESGPLVARCDDFNQDGTTGIADLYVVAGTPSP